MLNFVVLNDIIDILFQMVMRKNGDRGTTIIFRKLKQKYLTSEKYFE